MGGTWYLMAQSSAVTLRRRKARMSSATRSTVSAQPCVQWLSLYRVPLSGCSSGCSRYSSRRSKSHAMRLLWRPALPLRVMPSRAVGRGGGGGARAGWALGARAEGAGRAGRAGGARGAARPDGPAR
jgi:hypothetical protein